MVSADVRSPCGEFTKRQWIIHFAFIEARKLNCKLLIAYSSSVIYTLGTRDVRDDTIS